MTCPACGTENPASARFCASCGAGLGGGGGVRGDAGQGGALQRPAPAHFGGMVRPAFAPVLFRCPYCGLAARPMGYFSRGVNVAKAVALMIPLNFVGPLLFFLLRKDRMVCGACKRMLGTELELAMMQQMSHQISAGMGAGVAVGFGAGGPLAVYDPEEDLAVIERKGRRQRTRAWTWGAVTVGLTGVGVLAGVDGKAGATLGFMMMAVPPAIISFVAAIRSRGLGRLASMKRGREQRARVLELARVCGGRVNVSFVAAELRIELADAEQLLGSMVDGQRVDMEVDDSGRITYLFTELGGGG